MSTLALKNLNEISLEYCGSCEHLPPLGKLPYLTCLDLKGMDCIKHLGTEWCGDRERSFPALTNLTISEMCNLEEWTIADSVESFPCLCDLSIVRCPKLTGLPFLPTLRRLHIYDSSVTLVGSIVFLTSLKSLTLSNFANLDVLPVGLLQNHTSLEFLQINALPIRTLSNMLHNLSALKSLSILSCSNLEFFPDGLQNLSSLEDLFFYYCDNLRSFPAAILESLSSLTSLSFQFCKKLNPLTGPLQRATILQDLLINGCPELKHLPESMQQLTSLTRSRIWSCDGLCSLPDWLGRLRSLSSMDISNCKNLISVPDGFLSLKSLRELSIRGCPHLEKRCKNPKGLDWPKISHIPTIRINEKTIQCLDQ